MSVNRVARIRYLIIDKCLRNTKFRWTPESLLFQVNSKLEEDWFKPVTKDQLQKDLEAMKEEYCSPIESIKEGKVIYYEYADSSYAIQNTPLGEKELTRLQKASDILRQIKSFNFSEDVSYTINRLDNRLKSSKGEQTVVHFEEFGGLDVNEHMLSIKEAILSEGVLKVVYRKLGSAQHDLFTVHPYFLKEYQSRWYLFGYSETSKGPRLYAIDRIQEMEPIENKYIANRFISSDVYFNHMIGVMVNGSSKPEDIALWISPKMAPFVISKPIHHSQFRENYDQSGLFIQLHLVINPELIATLLGFGADLKVLYPSQLADQIKETAWKIAEQYSKE